MLRLMLLLSGLIDWNVIDGLDVIVRNRNHSIPQIKQQQKKTENNLQNSNILLIYQIYSTKINHLLFIPISSSILHKKKKRIE